MQLFIPTIYPEVAMTVHLGPRHYDQESESRSLSGASDGIRAWLSLYTLREASHYHMCAWKRRESSTTEILAGSCWRGTRLEADKKYATDIYAAVLTRRTAIYVVIGYNRLLVSTLLLHGCPELIF